MRKIPPTNMAIPFTNGGIARMGGWIERIRAPMPFHDFFVVLPSDMFVGV
jgi:hypothetical protein